MCQQLILVNTATRPQDKLQSCCTHCGFVPDVAEGHSILGWDRLQVGGVYSDANTVPSCLLCNVTRGVRAVGALIHQACRVANAHRDWLDSNMVEVRAACCAAASLKTLLRCHTGVDAGVTVQAKGCFSNVGVARGRCGEVTSLCST